MGSWLSAFGLTLYYGVGWLFMYYAASLLAGALTGATLGSFRRWYGARWQIGLAAGLWIGGQYAFIGCNWGTPWPFQNDHQVLWIASVVGFGVALFAAALSGWWFQETESSWIRAFRDHPWRWMTWKSVRVLAVSCVVLLIPLWFVVYGGMLRHFHRILPYYGTYQAAEKRWKPYGVWLTGELDKPLTIVVRTRRGLSAESLALIDDSPCPLDGLHVFGSQEIHDADLIGAASGLQRLKNIALTYSSLSDACLPALATCPNLKLLTISSCPLITKEGVTRFHEERLDVQVRLQEGYQVLLELPAELKSD